MSFHSIPELIKELKAGRMIIIVDDENRENEGDLVLAADFVSPQAINFMSQEARGLICAAVTQEQVKRLSLSLMVDQRKNLSPNKTAFTVSVEAAKNISTGISSADRARTIKVVADPSSKPEDIISPGHVFPICAHKAGVLKRAGHTEASVDFCRLAGLNPSAVICEIINPDGSMARVPDLKLFSKKHQIKMGSIEALIRYRIRHESFVEQKIQADFLSDICTGFKVSVFQDQINDREHLVFSKGNIKGSEPVLTRVHSACVTGDLFGGQYTRSGWYLRQSLKKIDKAGQGLLIYLRLEDRASGLLNRIEPYLHKESWQNSKAASAVKTSDKDKKFSYLPNPPAPDEKDYGVGAQILRALGVSKIRLISNSSHKRAGLKGYGLEIVETIGLTEK